MFINIHTHSQSAENEIAIRSLFHDDTLPDKVLCSIGIHPWHIERTNVETALYELDAIVQFENVVAIGETGLDRAISTPLEWQAVILRRHITLAEKVNKPLIIHCVRAYPELIAEIKNVTVPVIIHGFRGSPETVTELIKHNIYISFGAALLNAPDKLKNALSAVPYNRLFLETDESEHSIEEVYAAAARILDCTQEKLCEVIAQNSKRILHLV